jgi:hypothetical protein
MANRAYLVANDDSRSAGASDDGATYDGSEILAAASSIIPALWLTLFAEENALHHPVADQRIPTLLSPMKDARKRFRSRRKLLKETFRANLEAISAFEKLINEAHFDFVKVDAEEIWSLDPGSFESRLASAVGWFSSAEGADFEHLLDLAEIGDYERGGKAAAGERSPKHNLHGYGWVRDTPWDDEEECVEAAIDDEPREIVFGALSHEIAQSAILVFNPWIGLCFPWAF